MENVSKRYNSEEIYNLLHKEREYIFKGNEKSLQAEILKEIDEIVSLLGLPKVKEVRPQHPTKTSKDNVFADIVVLHEDDTLSLFEVKCSGKYTRMSQIAGISQLLYYKLLVETEIGGFIRAFLIDWKIEPETYLVCINNDLDISLLEYNNDRLLLIHKKY